MQPVKQLILTLFTLCILTGCIPGGSSSTEPDPANLVSLKVNVGMAEMGKDALTKALPSVTEGEMDAWAEPTDAEKMHTLRIVILHQDGKVEHNKFISFYGRAYDWYGWEEFKVTPNETKKVYLFVNEEAKKITDGQELQESLVNFSTTVNGSFKDYLDSYTVGTTFPTDKMADLTISLNENSHELSTPLPMSEVYSIAVGEEDVTETFYVTRAAVKFTYILYNNTTSPYDWTGLTISKVASLEYYLPRNLTYNDDGEITSFDVPTPNDTKLYNYEKAKTFSETVPAGKNVILPSFYLLEGTYANEYTTSITLSGITLTGTLENLPYKLPRNTHVVVRIAINNLLEGDVAWEVDLFPYTGVVLDPEFGL